MSLDSLHQLYVDKLKDLYSAEKQIIRALPSMIKAADSPKLQAALEEHLRVTEGHAARIEKISANLGSSPRGKKCAGMEGLVEEGKELLQEKPEPDVLDAGIIGAAQSVEHYEIAGYGTARSWAELLGDQNGARLLQQTLDEEKEADKILTGLAKSSINAMAKNNENAMAMASNGKKTTLKDEGGKFVCHSLIKNRGGGRVPLPRFFFSRTLNHRPPPHRQKVRTLLYGSLRTWLDSRACYRHLYFCAGCGAPARQTDRRQFYRVRSDCCLYHQRSGG
jgi:ferritin-like metal-binding protein YciE